MAEDDAQTPHALNQPSLTPLASALEGDPAMRCDKPEAAADGLQFKWNLGFHFLISAGLCLQAGSKE